MQLQGPFGLFDDDLRVAMLIYSALTSLDSYVEDAKGDFSWAAPDAEVHQFVNDLERPIGTYLYGRRMYETMRFWHDPPDLPPHPSYARDYAEIWRRADKVVYSRTLEAATTPRTRIEREFTVEAVRRLKATSGHDLSVGGAELAGVALEAGLVDEVHLFAVPVVVGGGRPAFRQANTRLELELLDARRFGNGTTYGRYAVRGA
jgi:dihydrofolate reductase